jgi:hypothetical protein
MSRISKQLSRLASRDGRQCHYCRDDMVFPLDKRQPQNIPNAVTRDHIVPRSMGGEYRDHNLILACRRCNEKRGDNLYYCSCAFCANVIESYMLKHFGGTIGPVKPRVWKHHDVWVTSYGLNSYQWKSWESAMRAVPASEKANV